MLRTVPCRWFELVTTRRDVARVLAALAERGAIELEARGAQPWPPMTSGADRALDRHRELERTWHAHWPAPQAGHEPIVDPAATLDARVAALDAWAAEAGSLVAERERVAAQTRALDDLARVLEALPADFPVVGAWEAGTRLAADMRIHAVAPHVAPFDVPEGVLRLSVHGPEDEYVVAFGRAGDLEALDEAFAARKARRIVVPTDLAGGAKDVLAALADRRDALARRADGIARELDALAERHDVARARGDLGLIDWLASHGSELSASDRLCRVTGWTTASDAAALCPAIDGEPSRCVARFVEPPAGATAPSLLANPAWVRAFERFARMLGQPGQDEADPSVLVAFLAPLLFGFMFGDVGQGAVVAVAGWLLRKHVPVLVLLVPGGLSAMAFGLLFGSVFAREDVIAAWWLHPLEQPVALLVAAMALGAAILVTGLALAALQAHWHRAGRAWWARDAGLVLAYVALLAAIAAPGALWLALAGAVWYVVGAARTAEHGATGAALAGVAQFVEHLLQLVVNTVSFARVGAFALAHAGLSAAVVALADAAGGAGYFVVLAIGNLLIVGLEGLVVGIQTTRLVMFEFFVRFMKGTGRAFHPLPPPFVPLPHRNGSHE